MEADPECFLDVLDLPVDWLRPVVIIGQFFIVPEYSALIVGFAAFREGVIGFARGYCVE